MQRAEAQREGEAPAEPQPQRLRGRLTCWRCVLVFIFTNNESVARSTHLLALPACI